MRDRLVKGVERTEHAVVLALLVMMLIAVALSTVELGFILAKQLWTPPRMLLNFDNMLEVFGFFLMVLLGLELLETIKAYLAENTLHVEVVMLVAIVAISRKIILLDYEKWTPGMVAAVAGVILALSTGYWMVKKAIGCKGPPGDHPPG